MRRTQKLLLDYSSSKALQMFFIYNGIISHDAKGNSIYFERKWTDNLYNYLFLDKLSKEQEKLMIERHFRNFYGLMSLLTLYDEIIIKRIDEFDVDDSNLGELGIKFEDEKKRITEGDLEKAKKIFIDCKNEIMQDFAQDCKSKFFEETPSVEELYKYINSIKYSKKDSNIKYWQNNDSQFISPKLYEFLSATFDGVLSGIKNNDATYYSSIINTNSLKKVDQLTINNVNECALKANFSSGLNIVPVVRTYDDIINLRNDGNMKAFREIFDNWIEALKKGDFETVSKMEKDVESARSMMLKISMMNRIESIPLVLIVKCALELVPFLGGAISGIEVIKSSLVNIFEKRNSWVMLPPFKTEYRCFHNKTN